MIPFWQRKKVLVTGHTGFKGSWLSLILQLAGAEVIGLSLPPETTPNLFNLAKVAGNMTSIMGDIRDFATVLTIFEQYQPELVLHLAAQPLVRYSYKAPVETYATNVLGTVHVLEAARQVGCVKAIVNVTTDKCYENQEWHWGYRERDRLGGYDPYSNSKACAELVTSAYRTAYFNTSAIGLASARAGNVIGGGDWAEDRLIPDIIRACNENTTLYLRNPRALRPWQHVLEPLGGYLLLAEKLYKEPAVYADAWNFGPEENDAKPVSWIADFLIQHWETKASWQVDEAEHVHEATYLKLDCAKAKSLLHWQPRWDLERGLQETMVWYKAFFSGAEMQEKTMEQIQAFFDTPAAAN